MLQYVGLMWVFRDLYCLTEKAFCMCVFPQDVTASSVVSCSQEKEGLPEKKPPSPVHSERDALLVGMHYGITAFTVQQYSFSQWWKFVILDISP